MAKLKEEIRRLGNKREFKRTGVISMAERGIAPSCNTCITSRQTHGKAVCPGKKVECYGCRLMGHFRGFMACKKKPAEEKAKTQRE